MVDSPPLGLTRGEGTSPRHPVSTLFRPPHEVLQILNVYGL